MYGDAGNDILESTFSSAGADIYLFGGTGNDVLIYDVTGSRPAFLYGESGNDRLEGGYRGDVLSGGTGNDTLAGLDRNDTLRGGSGNDKLFGYWFDVSVDDSLDTNDALFGDAGNDKLYGQRGTDELHGGLGKDLLVGGIGGDQFWFDAALNGRTNVDHIRDFEIGVDAIGLRSNVFRKIVPGSPISPDEFVQGPRAHDPSDRIIYQASTGKLFYDPDGTGPARQVLFAILDNKAPLGFVDFFCAGTV